MPVVLSPRLLLLHASGDRCLLMAPLLQLGGVREQGHGTFTVGIKVQGRDNIEVRFACRSSWLAASTRTLIAVILCEGVTTMCTAAFGARGPTQSLGTCTWCMSYPH